MAISLDSPRASNWPGIGKNSTLSVTRHEVLGYSISPNLKAIKSRQVKRPSSLPIWCVVRVSLLSYLPLIELHFFRTKYCQWTFGFLKNDFQVSDGLLTAGGESGETFQCCQSLERATQSTQQLATALCAPATGGESGETFQCCRSPERATQSTQQLFLLTVFRVPPADYEVVKTQDVISAQLSTSPILDDSRCLSLGSKMIGTSDIYFIMPRYLKTPFISWTWLGFSGLLPVHEL